MAEPWDLTPTRVKKRLSSTNGVNNESAPKKPKINRPGAISRRKQRGPSNIVCRNIFSSEPSKQKHCATRKQLCAVKDTSSLVKKPGMGVDSMDRVSHTCDVCCRDFSTPFNLRRHMRMTHSTGGGNLTTRESPISKSTQTEFKGIEPRPWLSKKTIPTTPMVIETDPRLQKILSDEEPKLIIDE